MACEQHHDAALSIADKPEKMKKKIKSLSIEVEGQTVEEAIKKALQELKISRNKVHIDVLSEEQKGLFGMPGAKPAKVRVSLVKDEKKLDKKAKT